MNNDTQESEYNGLITQRPLTGPQKVRFDVRPTIPTPGGSFASPDASAGIRLASRKPLSARPAEA
jgi:hypothetical protein